MVQFGKKAGTIAKPTKGGGGGNWIKSLRAGKDLRVVFLADPADWVEYREHYSEATKFFPCTQDRNCPGCNSDNEKLRSSSRRYAAPVLEVEWGTASILKIPVDLANRLESKAARNDGSLLGREWTLIREGSGLDTTYDVETGDKVPVANPSAYGMGDHVGATEDLLRQSYEDAWGDSAPKAAPEPVKEPVKEGEPDFPF